MKDSSTMAVDAAEDQSVDLKKYELMVIINPDIGDDATKKRLAELKKWISDRKGKIFFEDVWGLRDLAYNIKKHDRGFYSVMSFTIMPDMINEIDRSCRLEPEILRHMIISLPFKFEPKTLVQIEAHRVEEEKKEGIDRPRINVSSKKVEAQRVQRTVSHVAAPVKPVAKVEPKAAEPVKEVAKKSTEKKETTMADVDAKLKSIIDNPDINF